METPDMPPRTEMGPTEDLIRMWLDSLRLDGRSPDTARTWGIAARVADRELPYGLEEADTGEIRSWLASERFTGSTPSTYYSALSSFYRWATAPPGDEPWLSENPMIDLPRPAEPEGLPDPCTDE